MWHLVKEKIPLKHFPVTKSCRNSLPGLRKKLCLEAIPTINSMIITKISRQNERGYISRANYGHPLLSWLWRLSIWGCGRPCVFRCAQYSEKSVQCCLVLQYKQGRALYEKFKTSHIWPLCRKQLKHKLPAVRILWEITFVSEIPLWAAKAARHVTHAVWAGNPLERRDSRSREVLLLLCLLDTFAYSCVSESAISFVYTLTVCWGLTDAGRWEEGAREGVRKREREREKEAAKIKEPSNLLWSFVTKADILFS